MAKKKFMTPFILFTGVGPGGEDAKFSAQQGIGDDDEDSGNSVVQPQVYGEWVARVGADMDGNGNTDYVDYSQWMTKNGFASQITPKSNPDS